MNSNGNQINPMNSNEINLSPPPSPQSSYPTLVGFIGMAIPSRPDRMAAFNKYVMRTVLQPTDTPHNLALSLGGTQVQKLWQVALLGVSPLTQRTRKGSARKAAWIEHCRPWLLHAGSQCDACSVLARWTSTMAV